MAQQQPPPSIIWSNATLSPVISIDSQTNIYCSSNGSVATIRPNGAILGTNSICPAGGICQRDASGNFYFAGRFSPPVNFGVTNLTSGNSFIAKYNSNGTCLWAQTFGPAGSVGSTGTYNSLTVGDLQLDPQGNAYASTSISFEEDQQFSSTLYKFDPSGSNVWSAGIPFMSVLFGQEFDHGTVRIGGLSSSNGYVINFAFEPQLYPNYFIFAAFSGFNPSTGGMIEYNHWSFVGTGVPDGSHPAADSNANVYDVESGQLTKRTAAGAGVWTNVISGNQAFTMAPDNSGGVYVGDLSPAVSHYDLAGNLIWRMPLPALPNSFISDPYGNRALSLTNGLVYWLTPDVLSLPIITNQPAGETVMAGSNASFTVTAGGSTPLYYFWQQNSNAVPGGTNATLSLSGVTTNQAGYYSVTVSNFLGTTNSTSALLRVKNVELFYGSQLLTNGTYYFTNSPAFTVVNGFSNGSSFYTLDGSVPSFLSTAYTGPFSITNTTTIRAIGYSSDFSQSDVADTVIAVPPVQYTLTASTPGGGSVALNPPGGLYLSGSNVTVTATPAAGFSFLYWTHGASGNNPVLNLTMNTNISVVAVFGTTLSNTIAGNGQVFIYPPGPLYPYGSGVRLSALPQSGNCFGVWGNAASGNTNPLFYTISTANPVISAAFAATPGGDAALTVLISGGGHVNPSPSGNFFPLNQSVTLTAVPDAGKTFLGWSGNASGTNNPLNLTLTQSEVITANFTGTAALFINRPGGDGPSPQGFRFSLTSDMQSVFQIQSSSNLSSWQNIGLLTNLTSTAQFTDPNATNSAINFYKIAPGP